MTVAVACIPLIALAGCESSQTRSARLKAASATRAPEQGLRIAKPNPDVAVTAAVLLTDAASKRSAAVITLRNTSARPLAALPLLFSLKDAAGKVVFSNATPGASADLVTVPSLAPHATLTWIDDAIVGVSGARTVEARVGAAPSGAGSGEGGRVPALRVGRLQLERDPGGTATATGRVVNASSTAQERLAIYVTARRGGRVVAAGRAIVPLLKPGPKGARFTVFFVGDPAGAKLDAAAPPVRLG